MFFEKNLELPAEKIKFYADEVHPMTMGSDSFRDAA